MKHLTESYGSPLYHYDLDRVQAQAQALRSAISYPACTLLYAIKANPCPAIVKTLAAEGYGIDTLSPGEVAMALKCGVPPEQILYTENNMTDVEMADAHAAGVLINCGSLDRLERLGKHGASKASLRFNPDIGAGAHEKICTGGPLSKFGVHYSQVEEVLRIEQDTGIQVVGAHMHIGSGILDADIYGDAMRVILDVAKQLPHLEFIDFGGGIGIPYKDDESEVDIRHLGKLADELMYHFSEACGRQIELRLEPGRFLVAQAGTLLTTVTSIKTNPDGRIYVGCDTGFNHLLRPCMYDAYHRIENISNPDAPPTAVDIVGNICESGDVFARQRTIPMPKLGDVLAICDAGAYGMSMASTYNLRQLPAEVVSHNGTYRLARERHSIESLLNTWIWPTE